MRGLARRQYANWPGRRHNCWKMREAIDRTFTARLDCHYRLLTPERVDERTPLVVALHGFGASPEMMLRPTLRLFDPQPVIAAVEGPYRFFRGTDTRDVGYGWITSRNPAESIRLHRDMVAHVLDEAGRQFGVPADRRILLGFSQSVALNYRFVEAAPDAVRGVIGICGGLPGEWADGAAPTIRASVLHIARDADEIYTIEKARTFETRLRQRASDVEFHVMEGGHTMPSEGGRLVRPWVERVLSRPHERAVQQ